MGFTGENWNCHEHWWAVAEVGGPFPISLSPVQNLLYQKSAVSCCPMQILKLLGLMCLLWPLMDHFNTSFKVLSEWPINSLPFYRILALEKLGAVFNQVAFPLQYTPRKFVIHPESNNLIIIETDHNAYTEATKAQRKQQMAEVMTLTFGAHVYGVCAKMCWKV